MAKILVNGIGILLISVLIPSTQGGFVCYMSCMGTVGVSGMVVGPAIVTTLGFTSTGVLAGSWAASWMASYGGTVSAGSLFATLQGVGATGVMKYTGIPYAHAVCEHLCY